MSFESRPGSFAVESRMRGCGLYGGGGKDVIGPGSFPTTDLREARFIEYDEDEVAWWSFIRWGIAFGSAKTVEVGEAVVGGV